MPEMLQWITIIILVLLIYFGYIHGALKHMRFYKVRVGMTEKEVRRLIGKPVNRKSQGHKQVATYMFQYANRLSPSTKTKVRIVFDNSKVVDIYK